MNYILLPCNFTSYFCSLPSPFDVYNFCICSVFLYRFAAALSQQKVWVMNVVPINAPDTLPIIFERGLVGVYHDWCESFGTYPRSYDLLHADHLFSRLKGRLVEHSLLSYLPCALSFPYHLSTRTSECKLFNALNIQITVFKEIEYRNI